jgi:hypothetical protein
MTTLTIYVGCKFELHTSKGCHEGAALLALPLTGLVNRIRDVTRRVETALNIMAIGFKTLAFAVGV